ncbi:glycerol-3-phosphate 1-O-acyltransferase PlsY [Chamaesiphon minutus]|uniref:Glycerol-3-phosphate acyltransferase n=1 Tax=Chamaesiphon minutus (strain ATCC 27169 / PCC 6605) TaxID=1173020 RepID=K9UN17_CHAP6|nr:glycerol-3-phosphate 1-O-acyltransferase PlsY [Chamaesiphon minutus]AFY96210.1 acyl-phosphate glycerol 3-phosphate acyltransferase [Chamaesiphon minutus PCC 6605]
MLANTTIAFGIFIIAYFLGSFPTGYLAGKLLQGIDIREHGSGSTGATNVLRTLGKVPGSIVLLIDALKGALAVTIANLLFTLDLFSTLPVDWQAYLVPLAATGAILGHSKSIWLNFSGGKSVATGVGVLLAMSWQVGLATMLVFSITIAISRIVSMSSIVGAVSVTIWMLLFERPLPSVIFAIVGGIYVVWRHSANIQRILAGTEPKVGQKLESTT